MENNFHECDIWQLKFDLKKEFNIEASVNFAENLLYYRDNNSNKIKILNSDRFGIRIDTRCLHMFDIIDNQIKVKKVKTTDNKEAKLVHIAADNATQNKEVIETNNADNSKEEVDRDYYEDISSQNLHLESVGLYNKNLDYDGCSVTIKLAGVLRFDDDKLIMVMGNKSKIICNNYGSRYMLEKEYKDFLGKFVIVHGQLVVQEMVQDYIAQKQENVYHFEKTEFFIDDIELYEAGNGRKWVNEVTIVGRVLNPTCASDADNYKTRNMVIPRNSFRYKFLGDSKENTFAKGSCIMISGFERARFKVTPCISGDDVAMKMNMRLENNELVKIKGHLQMTQYKTFMYEQEVINHVVVIDAFESIDNSDIKFPKDFVF